MNGKETAGGEGGVVTAHRLTQAMDITGHLILSKVKLKEVRGSSHDKCCVWGLEVGLPTPSAALFQWHQWHPGAG